MNLSQDTLLIVMGVLAFLTVAVPLLLRRLRTVPEGYAAVVEFFDRHRRVVTHSPYWLLPLEKEKQHIFIGQREVRNVDLSNIFTHGGLPLTVELAYEMRLNPERMNHDELRYEDWMRGEQQIRILKATLKSVIDQLTPPPSSADPNRVNVGLLFSPFAGDSARQVQQMLEDQARPLLAARGIEIAEGSLLINRLKIPGTIIDAYMNAVAAGFSSAAEHELIQRLRDASEGMSDAGLVYLVNAVRNNTANLSTIFASGGFSPGMRFQSDGGVSFSVPPDAQQQGGTTPSPSPSLGSSSSAGKPPDRPLTPEDMAMLRSLWD